MRSKGVCTAEAPGQQNVQMSSDLEGGFYAAVTKAPVAIAGSTSPLAHPRPMIGMFCGYRVVKPQESRRSCS